MRVLVLGAGIAGITTAWFLAREGAEVTVVDRQFKPALETSFANGGHISASHTRPWANPQVPRQLVKFFGKRDGPVSFSLSLNPSFFSWGLSFLSNCRRDRYLKNAKTLRDLATYSRSTLQWLTEKQQINYDLCSTGILAIHKSIQSLEEASLESGQLDNTDNQEEVLDAYQCARLEPALTDAVDSGIIAGGIFSKNAATGNARSFTLELAKKCAELGVCFTFGVNIVGLKKHRTKLEGVETTKGFIPSTTVVLALGQGSRAVAKTAGINLPLKTVKGYSISLPMPNDKTLPSLGVLDEDRKVVTSRLGNIFRAAGIAEFGSTSAEMDQTRANIIIKSLKTLYPNSKLPDINNSSPWSGLRSATPDGPPILGPAPNLQGLFLNTGHGPMGWSLSAGAGQLVSNWINNQPKAIDVSGLTVSRFI